MRTATMPPTTRIYGAVTVNDYDHQFNLAYVDYDEQDDLEIYVQGYLDPCDPNSASQFGVWQTAQQYIVG